ncbi:MAG: GTP-binding protein [Bacillota bacterium]|nr:MAG: GTP-binding protein [Bacillota bacterium]MBS3949817.1 translational GTPase TypA [Peptococcaceae bacterium]
MKRNIAIIAHVDHGKTTLVDALLKQSHIFHAKEHVQERVMDSMDLERERGITIMAKNTGVFYKGHKINIVDTPGHADFGGEVERTLSTVDGVLLLVDAAEGPLAQTKYVLRKALAQKLQTIVVINKIDRHDAQPLVTLDKCLDLFIELGADNEQLDFPVLFASSRAGIAKYKLEDDGQDLTPLFETIMDKIPSPVGDPDGPLQLLVATLDWDDYLGRIAIGRVTRGKLSVGQTVAVIKADNTVAQAKITKLYQYVGLKRVEHESAEMGDIVAVAGLTDVGLGDTVADFEHPEPLPFVPVDEPTVTMDFIINDSPLAGREGQFITSRHLRERLHREAYTNVSMKIEDGPTPDVFHVSGRGELHLAILIETMRRQGYEFAVSRPKVIFRQIAGQLMEPMELLTVDVPEQHMGVVIEKLGSRKAQMLNMEHTGTGSVRIEFEITSRALLGFRSDFLTDTRGYGVMNHLFNGYGPYRGDLPARANGVLVAYEEGETTAYGLQNAEERGVLFIAPGVKVYEGMVVGESARASDLDVNICKRKQLTNIRSSAADDAIRLTTPRDMSLDRALEYISDDELVEVTPKSIRIRKRVLRREDRLRQIKKQQQQETTNQ